ncbi:MAG: phosphoribosylamine--glycine ligase [Treponema sp.]|jgi:phosphoribosylamine--glycine ligase|nr:phosphoribosylamine--glycine ligase [Treponema sp.]
MKILVVGSGGREHALAWKFAQSNKVEKVFVAPGNGGTATEAKCENVLAAADPASAKGQEELKQFALQEKIDITVIGPELPLCEGIADTFRETGLAVIGPGRHAARLESSKIYSKDFMEKYGIRAAKSSNFTNSELALSFAAEHFATNKNTPLVIKADGLAAGKGVIIAQNITEAEDAITALMQDKSLGDAGDSVLLEEFLDGKEVSILAAVSVKGNGYILPFISARDHKRRFEGGRGPNTGGMGAIAPVPDFSQAAQDDFNRSILEPTLKGIQAEGLDYCGFIFFGLMVKADRCYLLEYNVRLGDPETQAVLPLMDFDLVDLCTAMLAEKKFPLAWKTGAVCAPVAVADGYPSPYPKGDIITIDSKALNKTGTKVFISGAQLGNGEWGVGSGGKGCLKTSGGRVLTVSAFGKSADEAHAAAYLGLEAINFSGMGFRRDIGKE